jgi:hypothetical protein
VSASTNLFHMPMTVGDTLEKVQQSNADTLVVIFRARESGSWRVGWSVMDLEKLCMAREYLDHCIRDVIGQSYRENQP